MMGRLDTLYVSGRQTHLDSTGFVPRLGAHQFKWAPMMDEQDIRPRAIKPRRRYSPEFKAKV